MLSKIGFIVVQTEISFTDVQTEIILFKLEIRINFSVVQS